MELHVWQSFSCNNSGSYYLVARFDNADKARASAAELEDLPGVGPVLANRIVAYRDLHGSFAAVEDLLDVGGIGEAKLAAMRDSIAAP